MLRYIDGRFHVPGASFIIPSGFYLDTDPELSDDFGIHIEPRDGSCRFHITYHRAYATDEGLREIISQFDTSYIIRDIAPIQLNGLTGHDALYGSKPDEYYEARFQLPGQNNLIVVVTLESGKSPDILKEGYIPTVMNGIRAEDESIYFS